MLKVEENLDFFNISSFSQVKDHKFYNQNIEQVFSNLKKLNDAGRVKGTKRSVYLEKYNVYEVYNPDKLETPEVSVFFNKKYKLPCHSLILHISKMDGIKSLPKELLVLYIQGAKPFFQFPVKLLPKGIMSISFVFASFPFNGQDLSHLKALKHIRCQNKTVIEMPKFPPSIEYIDFEKSGLGTSIAPGIKDFKLSDYPKLKYLDVSSSGFTNKTVPKEWKEAKKNKTLEIYW